MESQSSAEQVFAYVLYIIIREQFQICKEQEFQILYKEDYVKGKNVRWISLHKEVKEN